MQLKTYPYVDKINDYAESLIKEFAKLDDWVDAATHYPAGFDNPCEDWDSDCRDRYFEEDSRQYEAIFADRNLAIEMVLRLRQFAPSLEPGEYKVSTYVRHRIGEKEYHSYRVMLGDKVVHESSSGWAREEFALAEGNSRLDFIIYKHVIAQISKK